APHRRTVTAAAHSRGRAPPHRADYRFFHGLTTRWKDNDAFGHVNNVEYYSYFDTAVTWFLLEHRLIGVLDGDIITVVVETGCRYHAPVAFPDRVTVGVRVARIGTSSVRYEIAVFRNDEDEAAADGHFVHVYVDRASMRPVPVPAASRAALAAISVIA
ncbi:MAG: acyl-CoA thioesterase, partial [Acetobacteraceae bacterium]